MTSPPKRTLNLYLPAKVGQKSMMSPSLLGSDLTSRGSSLPSGLTTVTSIEASPASLFLTAKFQVQIFRNTSHVNQSKKFFFFFNFSFKVKKLFFYVTICQNFGYFLNFSCKVKNVVKLLVFWVTILVFFKFQL